MARWLSVYVLLFVTRSKFIDPAMLCAIVKKRRCPYRPLCMRSERFVYEQKRPEYNLYKVRDVSPTHMEVIGFQRQFQSPIAYIEIQEFCSAVVVIGSESPFRPRHPASC